MMSWERAVVTGRREGARGETGEGRGRDWTFLGCPGEWEEDEVCWRRGRCISTPGEEETGRTPSLGLGEAGTESPIPASYGAAVTCPSYLWE